MPITRRAGTCNNVSNLDDTAATYCRVKASLGFLNNLRFLVTQRAWNPRKWVAILITTRTSSTALQMILAYSSLTTISAMLVNPNCQIETTACPSILRSAVPAGTTVFLLSGAKKGQKGQKRLQSSVFRLRSSVFRLPSPTILFPPMALGAQRPQTPAERPPPRRTCLRFAALWVTRPPTIRRGRWPQGAPSD